MVVEDRLKLLVVGPPKVGKSCVANFLSGTKDTPSIDYKETCPLRILETVVEGVNVGGRRQMGRGTRVTVELWDVGGNPRFQNCWPAIAYGADGIIFVINPEISNQAEELRLWHKSFAVPAKIPDHHCLVFCHHSTPPVDSMSNPIPKMPQEVSRCKAFETSLDFKSDNFKDAFEKLVSTIMTTKREQEENSMLDDGPIRVGESQ